MRFYTQTEEANFRRVEGDEGWFKRTQFSLNRIWPVLKGLGGPILRRSVLPDSESEGEEEEEAADSEHEEREEKEPANAEKQKAAWMADALFDDPYLTHSDFADPAWFHCEDEEEVAEDWE
jgi:hypothetical protein